MFDIEMLLWNINHTELRFDQVSHRKDCDMRETKLNPKRGRKRQHESARQLTTLTRQSSVGAPDRRLSPGLSPGPGTDAGAEAVTLSGTDSDGNTAFTLYLREIGQVKLLSVREEKELAARIKRGDEAAREQMIKANLRLVVHIARQYEYCGLPLLDLINEGNIGLMKAVERFDPAKGAKFSTYASLWIKQAIRRGLAGQARTIRLPVHATDRLYRLRRKSAELRDELGREPTEGELAHELGLSTRRIAALTIAALSPASLDAVVGDDNSSRLGELVEDKNAQLPGEALAKEGDLALAVSLLGKLDPRAARILRFRFGLDGTPEKTLEEIGRKFSLTRERIRQLQNDALVQLRRHFEQFDAVQTAA
jgi:RNA polymerase primary sigma factor